MWVFGVGAVLYLSFKVISLLVIWSWKCNNVLKKKITSLHTSVIRACQTTLNIFPHWISEPYIRKHNNYNKASSGAERFAQNLRACKNSQYNVQNCKSGRHNQRHTFRRCNSRYRPTSTNSPYYGLKVKGRKKENTKTTSPCRQYQKLYAIKHCHNTSLLNSTKMSPAFLPFDEPNLCNDYIFMDSESNNGLCFLNQVDPDTDLLDNVILHQVVIQLTNNKGV